MAKYRVVALMPVSVAHNGVWTCDVFFEGTREEAAHNVITPYATPLRCTRVLNLEIAHPFALHIAAIVRRDDSSTGAMSVVERPLGIGIRPDLARINAFPHCNRDVLRAPAMYDTLFLFLHCDTVAFKMPFGVAAGLFTHLASNPNILTRPFEAELLLSSMLYQAAPDIAVRLSALPATRSESPPATDGRFYTFVASKGLWAHRCIAADLDAIDFGRLALHPHTGVTLWPWDGEKPRAAADETRASTLFIVPKRFKQALAHAVALAHFDDASVVALEALTAEFLAEITALNVRSGLRIVFCGLAWMRSAELLRALRIAQAAPPASPAQPILLHYAQKLPESVNSGADCRDAVRFFEKKQLAAFTKPSAEDQARLLPGPLDLEVLSTPPRTAKLQYCRPETLNVNSSAALRSLLISCDAVLLEGVAALHDQVLAALPATARLLLPRDTPPGRRFKRLALVTSAERRSRDLERSLRLAKRVVSIDGVITVIGRQV